MDGFEEMRLLDAVAAREVGDGAGGWRKKPEVRCQKSDAGSRRSADRQLVSWNI